MGSSSEEIDQAGSEKQVTSDDNTGIGRSYECTFCKRGFTNAQALGGHMNIHRKDKAKAKQKNNQPSKTLEDSTSKYYASNNSFHHHQQQQQQQRPYSTAMAAYMSYQLYFPSSPSNPSAGPTSYLNGYSNDPHPVDQTESLSLSTADHEEEIKNIGEVDLELRLGYQYP